MESFLQSTKGKLPGSPRSRSESKIKTNSEKQRHSSKRGGLKKGGTRKKEKWINPMLKRRKKQDQVLAR